MSDSATVVADVADEVWERTLTRQPLLALRVGRDVESLPHGTLTEAEDDARFADVALQRLEAVDAETLSARDRDTLGYVRHSLREQAHADESWWWRFPVTPYQLMLLGVGMYPGMLFARFALDRLSDSDRYASLVRDLVATVQAIPGKLEAQFGRGWVVPAPAIGGCQAAVAGARAAAEAGVRLRGREDVHGRMSANEHRRAAERVDRLVDDELLPAFDAVAAFVDGPGQERAVEGVGLGQYPGGENAYRTMLDSIATYHADPSELHDLGQQQVDELTEQMSAVRAEVGFTGDETAYRDVLHQDPRFLAKSPAEVEATYRRHLAAIEPLIDRWFTHRPEAPYDVKRLDAGAEAGMSYGFYEAPTTGQPIGRYRFNGSGLDSRSQVNAAALIFHELIPGHHFHLARQSEDRSLHPLRAQAAPLALGAYTEGWAEYAASLGFEMGLFEDPFDRYGALVHQRFIAQRLVVDTGMNALGWTLDRARDYMSRTTMESDEQVRTETLRYSTDLPAQALGYRIGSMKFWELRRRAESALGDAFDIRRFHEVVLGGGTLPLPTVAANVESWITTEQAGGIS